MSSLEVAILDVKEGQTAPFEIAFRKAQGLIEIQPGYQRHQLQRCAEADHRYLLLVWWESLEHHTEGFRRSAEYPRWSELLHPFYEPFPTVEHYTPFLEGPNPRS